MKKPSINQQGSNGNHNDKPAPRKRPAAAGKVTDTHRGLLDFGKSQPKRDRIADACINWSEGAAYAVRMEQRAWRVEHGLEVGSKEDEPIRDKQSEKARLALKRKQDRATLAVLKKKALAGKAAKINMAKPVRNQLSMMLPAVVAA